MKRREYIIKKNNIVISHYFDSHSNQIGASLLVLCGNSYVSTIRFCPYFFQAHTNISQIILL
jgi:hypothetical protein